MDDNFIYTEKINGINLHHGKESIVIQYNSPIGKMGAVIPQQHVNNISHPYRDAKGYQWCVNVNNKKVKLA